MVYFRSTSLFWLELDHDICKSYAALTLSQTSIYTGIRNHIIHNIEESRLTPLLSAVSASTSLSVSSMRIRAYRSRVKASVRGGNRKFYTQPC
jgi:hypothetical protein